MNLANPNEASQFVTDAVKSYEPMRAHIGRTVGVNRCMFTGRHWISEEMMYRYDTGGRHLLGRSRDDMNPDTPKLRVTLNRIPRFIHEVAAATFPDMIEFDVRPPDRDSGPEASNLAHVIESMLVSAVDCTGFLNVAREANYRRCIDGLHGIGISVFRQDRMVGKVVEPDCVVKAFAFDAHRLILDPAHQELDLWDHEYVIYRDVWTITKIQRELGVKLDPTNLRKVAELMPLEMAMSDLSQGRLYTWLKDYSETKGAFVYQVHIKDEAGRFPTMLIGIDTGDGKNTGINWINFDNQESPFGGNGLPFMLLHGYREPDNMVSQSDVRMLKADQDNINLLRTMFARVHQKQAGFQVVVAKGSMDGDGTDDYRAQFNNYVGGVIEYDPGRKDKPLPPPFFMQSPPPSPYLQDVISLHQERDMPSQIHRAQITAGATKSHVPDSTFQSALQQAGQVLGNRQREDSLRYEKFATVLCGTYVKLVQQGVPSALVQLRRAGFDATDFAVLQNVDPRYAPCEIRLTDRSIRFRSVEQKEEGLNTAAQLQMITPEEYRKAKADLDAPLTTQDGLYSSKAKKAAMRVLLGEEWIPRSLGNATPFFLDAFRDAMLDRRAETDPRALLRLDQAVQSMLALANMEMQQQQMAQTPPPPPSAAGQPDQGQQEMPQEVNVADLITSLSSGGGGAQGSQPEAA